jgi:hypothetical protein
MKFNGIQDKVFVDFKQKIKEKTGTRYTIISDLLKSQEKIIDYICDIFKFVTTPLIINGIKINETLPHHLSFKGGTLFYSSKIAEMGSLCICENGKQVINFPLHNSLVPQEIILNFDQLPLTQERASLDFKNNRTVQALELLINVINISNLSFLEKSALFNGLYPILGFKQFNLMKKMSELIAAQPQLFLPNDPLLKDLMGPNYLYLNPQFFATIPLPCAFAKENYKIYLLKTASLIPFAIINLHQEQHVFCNDRFFNPAYRNLSQKSI